jgi:hypothetical protein
MMTTIPDYPIIGVGTSAGSLEAHRRFFHSLPADLGARFVLVQSASDAGLLADAERAEGGRSGEPISRGACFSISSCRLQ